jgi:hypothetical protein
LLAVVTKTASASLMKNPLSPVTTRFVLAKKHIITALNGSLMTNVPNIDVTAKMWKRLKMLWFKDPVNCVLLLVLLATSRVRL